MFNNVTDREKLLATKVKALEEEIAQLRNDNSYLAENSKQWASKFRDPQYSVPARVIEEMEKEADKYRDHSRAEREALKARIAVLTGKVIDLTRERAGDLFGKAGGSDDITYEFAASHIEAQPTEEDENMVHLKLSQEWAKRMNEFAS